MAPIVHCVRHGQACHNLSIANHGIRDPLLTEYGEEQCRSLQTTFPALQNVDLVVSSPLQRTLFTALIAFDPILKSKNLQVIALPELQETSDLPCDTGSAVEDLRHIFANQPVDLSLVQPGWESKRSRWAATSSAIQKRAQDVKTWLMQRPEAEIVVVTHGGFLQVLTAARSSSASASIGQTINWGNAEWRSYVFNSSDPEAAYLVETLGSREHRGAKGSSSAREESARPASTKVCTVG